MTTDIDTRVRLFAVEITATTEIRSSAEAVWGILCATSEYPQWNPFVVRLEGDLAPDSRIRVDMKPGDGKAQTLHPRIVEYEPGSHFTWLGHVGVPGLLDGRHSFRVEPLTASSCRLVQSEVLSGLLVPFFRSMLTRDTPKAFVALNEALSERATR